MAPGHGGQGQTEERGRASRSVGGSFNKQGNLLMRLVLGGCKVSRSSHPSVRILKVYVEALTGFSPVYQMVYPVVYIQMVSTAHYYLKSVSLRQLLGQEGRQNAHTGIEIKDRGGGEEPPMLGSSSRVRWLSDPLGDLLQCFPSCNDLQPSSAMCPEQSPRVLLAGKWLVGWLSGRTGSRWHSTRLDTCKRKHRLR